MNFLVYQLCGVIFVLALFKFCSMTAAMRGMKGEPMPFFIQRTLRVIFFFVLTGPIIYFVPYTLPFLLVYLYTYVDLSELKSGRLNVNMRHWRVWYWMKERLSLSLVRTTPLDGSKIYIFAIHPHGILPWGGMINFVSGVSNAQELFPGVQLRGLAASFCFYLPGWRDILLQAGVCDAARYSARNLLENGYSLYLVPGGATEALYARPDKDVYVLRNRHGFIRLALQHGAVIVPVVTFNENNAYKQIEVQSQVVKWIKSQFQKIFGLSLPLLTNIFPRKTKITTVVGAPLTVPHLKDPTHEQVCDHLERYIKAVSDLWNEHGPTYNIPPNKTLEII